MRPRPIDFKDKFLEFNHPDLKFLNYEFSYSELLVVCVYFGMECGSDFVNKLFRGVKKNLNLPHKFVCFTDDPEGLDKEIKLIKLEPDE